MTSVNTSYFTATFTNKNGGTPSTTYDFSNAFVLDTVTSLSKKEYTVGVSECNDVTCVVSCSCNTANGWSDTAPTSGDYVKAVTNKSFAYTISGGSSLSSYQTQLSGPSIEDGATTSSYQTSLSSNTTSLASANSGSSYAAILASNGTSLAGSPTLAAATTSSLNGQKTCYKPNNQYFCINIDYKCNGGTCPSSIINELQITPNIGEGTLVSSEGYKKFCFNRPTGTNSDIWIDNWSYNSGEYDTSSVEGDDSYFPSYKYSIEQASYGYAFIYYLDEYEMGLEKDQLYFLDLSTETTEYCQDLYGDTDEYWNCIATKISSNTSEYTIPMDVSYITDDFSNTRTITFKGYCPNMVETVKEKLNPYYGTSDVNISENGNFNDLCFNINFIPMATTSTSGIPLDIGYFFSNNYEKDYGTHSTPPFYYSESAYVSNPNVSYDSSSETFTISFDIPKNIGGKFTVGQNTASPGAYLFANNNSAIIEEGTSSTNCSKGVGMVYSRVGNDKGYSYDKCFNNGIEYNIIAGGSDITIEQDFIPYVMVYVSYGTSSNGSSVSGSISLNHTGRSLSDLEKQIYLGIDVTIGYQGSVSGTCVAHPSATITETSASGSANCGSGSRLSVWTHNAEFSGSNDAMIQKVGTYGNSSGTLYWHSYSSGTIVDGIQYFISSNL